MCKIFYKKISLSLLKRDFIKKCCHLHKSANVTSKGPRLMCPQKVGRIIKSILFEIESGFGIVQDSFSILTLYDYCYSTGCTVSMRP